MNRRFIQLTAILFLVLMSAIVTSCSKDDDESDALAPYSALFQKTDYFIDMLDTVYEHYDALGKKAADSYDGKFTVTPMGRLIIVKKKASATMTYSEIENALKIHYKNNSKVNEVFQNNGGTITIDCRK